MSERFQLTIKEARDILGHLTLRIVTPSSMHKLRDKLRDFARQSVEEPPMSEHYQLTKEEASYCVPALKERIDKYGIPGDSFIYHLHDHLRTFVAEPIPTNEPKSKPIDFHRDTLYCPFLSSRCIQEQCMMWRVVKPAEPTSRDTATIGCALTRGMGK